MEDFPKKIKSGDAAIVLMTPSKVYSSNILIQFDELKMNLHLTLRYLRYYRFFCVSNVNFRAIFCCETLSQSSNSLVFMERSMRFVIIFKIPNNDIFMARNRYLE